MDVLKVRTDLMDIINKVSIREGFKSPKVIAVKTNAKGEGFLGQIFIVTVADDDNNNSKNLELVLKAAFKDAKIRQGVPIRASFENEIAFYTEVFPKLEEFRRNSKNGHKVPTDYLAKCYGNSLNDACEVLVLENLFKSGFELFEKTKILNAEHIELIFKTYGHYHGMSLAFKDQHPEEFYSYEKSIHNLYAKFIDNGNTIFEDSLTDMGNLINASFIPGEDDDLIEKFAPYAGKEFANLFRNSIGTDSDHAVILHGDCWSNNMMFKYEGTDNDHRLVGLRLLDFQIIKLGSPACDLSYCLYSGGGKKEFDRLDDFLRVYHDALSETVRNLGSDPETLLSFRQLKDEWTKWSRFGFVMATVVVKMKMIKSEDIFDLTDMDFENMDNNEAFKNQKFNNTEFCARMKHLLRHMFSINAL